MSCPCAYACVFQSSVAVLECGLFESGDRSDWSHKAGGQRKPMFPATDGWSRKDDTRILQLAWVDSFRCSLPGHCILPHCHAAYLLTAFCCHPQGDTWLHVNMSHRVIARSTAPANRPHMRDRPSYSKCSSRSQISICSSSASAISPTCDCASFSTSKDIHASASTR